MSNATMKRSAWEVAYHAGRRVFFESATLTLRQCPENYLLAIRQASEPYRWVADPDVASGITAQALDKVLDQHAGHAGDALADAVELAFWGELGARIHSPRRSALHDVAGLPDPETR
jgi:hypothetical protein